MGEIKKLRFWGTGAGEAVPNPFCKCRICEYARKNKGKDLRTRSGFRIDEKIMIDASEDFISQSVKYCEDTFDLEHILYSHLHADHYDREILWLHKMIRDNKPDHKLHIHCSCDAAEAIKKQYKDNGMGGIIDSDNVEICSHEFYETYEIDGCRVTPLKGSHGTIHEKNASNYLIEFKSGKKMYYALDTGIFPDETIEHLKNHKIDLLIMECTFLRENSGLSGHMDLTNAKNELDRLFDMGIINEKTAIYLTHICAVNKTHDELELWWNNHTDRYKVTVAYDGLCLENDINVL